MTIASGTRLGVYAVLSPLGAGGMGEVYRARDTKLERDVAIKILPESLAVDPDRLARFEREARVLASLNHNNIGAIYGVEEGAGVTALVLELVEGETLAQKLEGLRGEGLGISEALAIARQICDALDAAHERGIVHRDLKPANIAITSDDVVKVLDFGLAKAGGAGGSGAAELTNSPTLMAPTIDGLLLGTAPYMSPEQARGKAVDRRTDIWAFGCVLFEMLTGRQAFAGETTTDVLAAIVSGQPDWNALLAPPSVVRLLRRCLDKDVKRRLRDIGDARLDVDDVLAGNASDVTGRPAAARRVQFQRLTDFVGMNESPALSPDGKMVAFVAVVGGRRQIWIRLLAGGAPLQITRDDADHENPRWVPDSSALIYFVRSSIRGAQGTIWEVAALGGAPRPIVPALNGGDVSHDGRRIAVFQINEGKTDLVAVARDGSGGTSLRPLPPGAEYSYPRWSPDDRWVAFQCERNTVFDQRLHIMPAAGGEAREVARASILKGAAWLPDGSGLVYSSSTASTVPYPPTFNLRSVGRDGRGDGPVTFGDLSYVEPDVHHSGKLVACRIRIESDIWRFPVGGTPIENTRNASRITRQTGQVQTPSVSPDGREVVYLSDNGGHGNLWVAKTDGSGVRQITFERDPDATVGVPVWAPAGNRIGFIVTRLGHTSLFVINPDGSGVQQLLPDGGYATAWSGDGEWLYYTPAMQRPWSIKKIAASGGAPVAVQGTNAFGSAVAPDGSAFYFVTQVKPEVTTSGDWEICVARPENGPGVPLARIAASRIPVLPSFIHPVISPDGRWLALSLTEGATTNLWKLPTDGGPLQPVTDFGERAILIVRRVSWAPDGESLYAAVGETAADVILLDGLLP